MQKYVLINLFNANTEQVKILEKLQSPLKNLDISQNKHTIFTGDFSIFCNSKVKVKGAKPLPKRKSITKLIEIRESLHICNIWRIRNPNTFTFRQNHSTRFIERRLDIFISNCFQEFVNDTEILPALSTDHSQSLISFLNDKSNENGSGF